MAPLLRQSNCLRGEWQMTTLSLPSRIVVPISLSVLLLVLGACGGAQSSVQQQGSAAHTDAETSAARAEIEAATADLTRLLSVSVDSAALRLTEDYHWLPPDAPEDSGRANWVRLVKGMTAGGKYSEQGTVESLVASGPIAVSRGQIIATFTPGPSAAKGAKASIDTAKYLWLWRRVDGHW